MVSDGPCIVKIIYFKIYPKICKFLQVEMLFAIDSTILELS